MSTYKTEQKSELLKFLEENSDRAMTIDQICEEMAKRPDYKCPPGKSTVYRLVSRLADEDMVKQFTDGMGRKTSFQITGGSGCVSHIHMKCTRCGKLLHMSDEVTTSLCRQVAGSDSFTVSTKDTVLYGVCGACSGGRP